MVQGKISPSLLGLLACAWSCAVALAWMHRVACLRSRSWLDAATYPYFFDGMLRNLQLRESMRAVESHSEWGVREYVFVPIHACMHVYLCMYISLSVSLSLLSLCLSLSVCVCLSLFVFACVGLSLSVSVFVCGYAYTHIHVATADLQTVIEHPDD